VDFFDQMDEARIAELEKKISEARKSYFNGVATVSDELYDAWMDELEELKKDSPQVLAVGAPVSEAWPKTRHVIPMGSLGKINSLEELTSWVHEVSRPPTKEIPYEELIVTDKLDGLSTSITYVEGVLTQGVTRGDGLVGSDVTPNIARIPDVPNKLPKPLDLTLRAEIVLYRGVFEERFQSNYKNTRNAASGIIQRLDGRGCEHLSVRFFEVAEGFDCEKRSDQFEFMDQLGLPIPNWYVTAMVPGAKTPHDLWVEYQQTVREQLPYDIDGLVVEVNDLGYLLELGIGSDNRPKGARAFKFSAVTRETVAVRRIDQVGGTGRITPVAEFRPVRLLGAEVSRASLYNQDYIKQIGFDVGAKILVARANDVIPRVVSVLQPTGTISKPPTHCPECGTPTEWDGKFLICPNIYECPAQTEGRIKQWIRELNILGWGDVLIERLVSEKLVTSVPDLYKLSREQIASLDRMGTTSAENVLRTLWEVVPMPLEQFLGALSIPFCATTTVRIIVDAGFDSLAKIQEASEQDLQQIAGVGPRRASAICGWLRRHEDLLSDLQEAGVKIKDRPVGVLTGKSICFTGKMAYKRAEMERMAQEQGASVKNTVGKGLTLLVVGDNVGQKKIAAAQKHKTQTLTVEEFLQLIGG
jgi:DNA ligase (NAD+)